MTRALAVLTLAAGLAVLVHAPAGSSRPTRPAPHVRVQNAALLRVASGHLWWVGNTCAPTRYALASGRLTVSPKRYCLIWPAPNGTRTLAAGSAAAFPAPPAGVAVLSGARLDTVALTPVREDDIAPPPVWSSDSKLALVCTTARPAPSPTIELVEPPWTTARSLSHRCTPALAGQSVLSSAHGIVYDNSRPYLTRLLRAGMGGGPWSVTAMAFAQGDLAVAISNPRRSEIVDVDTTTGSVRRLRTAAPVHQMALSPEATQLWYQLSTSSKLVLEELDGRVQLGGVPGIADAYAWSPDGRFIAAAQNDSVQVFDREDGHVATIDTGPVSTLAWTA
jgi:hypothetical protein